MSAGKSAAHQNDLGSESSKFQTMNQANSMTLHRGIREHWLKNKTPAQKNKRYYS